jgi:hypothetical protein
MPIFSFLFNGNVSAMVAPRAKLGGDAHVKDEVNKCMDAMIFTVTDRVAAWALSELNRDLQIPPSPEDVEKFGDFVRMFRQIHGNRRTVENIMEPTASLGTFFSDLIEAIDPMPSLEEGLHNAILDCQTRLVEENLKEWPDLSKRTVDGDMPIHLVRQATKLIPS